MDEDNRKVLVLAAWRHYRDAVIAAALEQHVAISNAQRRLHDRLKELGEE